MTGRETERLLLSFPDDPPFLRVLFPDYRATDLYLGDRLRAGLSNPSLLWQIAQSYAHSCQALPEVDLPAGLRRAYRFLTDPDGNNEPMALAHMLHLPENALEGDLVDAALIGEDDELDRRRSPWSGRRVKLGGQAWSGRRRGGWGSGLNHGPSLMS
jgi:hypothetical protein